MHPFTILIAEDDEEDRMLIKDAFNDLKVEKRIEFVENGEELLDFLYHKNKYIDSASFPKPNLLILDLNMPKKDGKEVLIEIKSNKDFKKIPIVILSTSSSHTDIIATYDLGVNSFITKPISYSGLLEVVASLNKYWFEIVELPEY